MKPINTMKLQFDGRSVNEAFSRTAVAAFLSQLDPTVEELADVKTAVSEAVTNAIVHGYAQRRGTVRLHAFLYDDNTLRVDVIDNGCGIADVEQARKPFFSTMAAQERSGMGFTIIESFMDNTEVFSQPGKGTTVRMTKKIGASAQLRDVHAL